MTNFNLRLANIALRIQTAARQCDRDPASITLLAVSKTYSSEVIKEAIQAGLTQFGESYLQEALPKIHALQNYPLVWHFIGPIQSNKTRGIANAFDWVHSVDRLSIAQRLSDQRPQDKPPLCVCLQVNVSNEPSKSGAGYAQAAALAHAIAGLPRLKLRGLMAIPRPSDDFAEQCAAFRQLRLLYEQLNEQGLVLDTLSMGMTDDLEAAIHEGATIVRVGTGLFGARPAAPTQIKEIND